MASVRIEFSQFGHFESFTVYWSNTSIDVSNLPVPLVSGLTTMFYIHASVPDGDNYYRVAVVRGGEVIFSEEMYIRVTNEWSPVGLTVVFSLEDGTGTPWISAVGGYSFSVAGGTVAPQASVFPNTTIPCFYFDKNKTVLQPQGGTIPSVFDGASLLWAFVVAKKDGTSPSGSQTSILSVRYTTAAKFNIGLGNNSGDENKFFVGGRRTLNNTYERCVSSTRSDDGKSHLFYGEVDYSTAMYKIVVDGTLEATKLANFGTGVSDSAQTNVFIPDNTATNDLKGWVGFLAFGNTPLRTLDRVKLEGWAAHKYNITANLPDNHPYKWVKPIVAEDNKPYGVQGVKKGGGLRLRFGVSGIVGTLQVAKSTAPINPETFDSATQVTSVTAMEYIDQDSGFDSVYYMLKNTVDGVPKYSDVIASELTAIDSSKALRLLAAYGYLYDIGYLGCVWSQPVSGSLDSGDPGIIDLTSATSNCSSDKNFSFNSPWVFECEFKVPNTSTVGYFELLLNSLSWGPGGFQVSVGNSSGGDSYNKLFIGIYGVGSVATTQTIVRNAYHTLKIEFKGSRKYTVTLDGTIVLNNVTHSADPIAGKPSIGRGFALKSWSLTSA